MNRTLVSVVGRLGRSATPPLRRILRPVGMFAFVAALLMPAAPVSAATATYTLTVPTTITAGTNFVASFAKSGAPAGSYHTWSVGGGTKVSGCGISAATCTVRPNKITTFVAATGKVSSATGSVTISATVRKSTGSYITSRSTSRRSGNPLLATTVTRSESTVLGGQSVLLSTVPSGAGPWTYTTAGAYFTYLSGTTKTSQSPIVKMTPLANVATATRTITHVIKDTDGNSISFALPIGVTNSTSGSTVIVTSDGEPLTSGTSSQAFVANLTIAPATGGYPFTYKVTRTKVSTKGGVLVGAAVVATGMVETPDTGASINLTLPSTFGFYSYAFTVTDATGNTWTRKASTIQVGQASAFVTVVDATTGAPVGDASSSAVCRLLSNGQCDPDFWMVNTGGIPGAGYVQDLLPGNYSFFIFDSPTHANSAAVHVTIVAGQRVPAVISMAPASVTSFSGTVTDDTGNPLANAWVSASGPALGSGSVRTDESGHYVFMNRPAGDYEISVYVETDTGEGRASAEVAYDGSASLSQDLEVTIVTFE